jgi:regulatory protein
LQNKPGRFDAIGLDATRLDAISKSDKFSNPVEARKKAMDYLARREHGRAELVDKLTRYGFDDATACTAVDQLVEDRLQSDTRFVEAFIASRINQGKGPLRIRADLRERGIGDAVIAQGLQEAAQDWYAAASDVRQKKFGNNLPRDFNEKARQMRFLQSRGFDTDHIQAAVSA